MRSVLCWLFGHARPGPPEARGEKRVTEKPDLVDCWEIYKCPRCGHLWESHLVLAEEDLRDS